MSSMINKMNLTLVRLPALIRAHVKLEHPLRLGHALGFRRKAWVLCYALLLAFLAIRYFMRRRRTVYLVDFACFKPHPSRRLTKEVLDRILNIDSFTQENIEFQLKVMERSGLGPEETYCCEAYLHKPMKASMEEARKEAETLMVGVIDELFEKTRVNATDIGILVLNCSLFSPAPSMSSIVVNRYKFRSNIRSFNLSGMGCSAGLIGLDLAQHLLQVHKESFALVVNAENMTLNFYDGNERSMLVSNCLFRTGGAAVLLSNKPSDHRRSKYQLMHSIRTHNGSDDRSYTCVSQREDDTGKRGLSLSKDLMGVAGEALRSNIVSLGPLVLPISEQLRYLASVVAKRVIRTKTKPYVPDFKLAFEHFCVHPGGRGVLDEVEKNLSLTKWHMEPARMTLYKFGNTSSSSPWYELAYLEAKGRMKKGDRTWQIGLGSGFKCTSVVWRALKTVDPTKENPWVAEADDS